jgi:hypothetical protein
MLLRTVLLGLAACVAPAETLLEVNFAGDYQPVAGNERAQGVLPVHWRDNSSFARAWIRYSRQEEQGRPFLRVEVTKVHDGRCQFLTPLARFEAEKLLRLSVSVRNPDHLIVQMGVRRISAPYRFLAETSHSFPAGWSDQQFYLRVPRSDFDTGFFVVMNGVGTVDLANLRLEPVTMAEIRAARVHAVPPGGPKNLVRQSMFPLGLQSGWSLDRDSSDGDEVEIGPGPESSLHIQARKPMQLFTAPIAIRDLGAAHTASVYLRGHGSGALAAIADLKVLARQRFELQGDEWQRIQVHFTPDILARAHGLRIEGAGDFLLNRLQVEQGAEATAFEPPGPCEVALAASDIRVQFDNEPAVVKWATTGGPQCRNVRAKVVNVYGDEKGVEPQKDGTIGYNVFRARPYGSFRIEAWVEDRVGHTISPVNELVVHRLHRPRYWMKDAPNSPFGTHTNSTRRHILMAKAAGINWVRLHDSGTPYIGWYHLERKPGEWTFRDEPLNRYRQYGMKILGAYSTAPEWASHFEKPHDGYFDRYYQPRDLKAFANYVSMVTKRYAGVIDTYDLWNEPWGAGYWGVGYDEARKAYVASKQGPAEFARLMQTAWDAAKAADPKVTVLGVQTSAGQGGTAWTRGVAAADGIRYCDVMCFHNYTSDAAGYPADSVELGMQSAFEPLLDGAGKAPKPFWMTEGSSTNSRMGNGMYRHTLPYPDDEDPIDTSDRLARYVVANLARGAGKVFLYSMHSHTWFGAGNAWRALVTEEGYLHPSAAAHSAMAWFLEDTKMAKSESPAAGVTSYLFKGAGRTVAVLMPQPKHAAYTLPAAGFDLFGNPLAKGSPLGNTLVYLTTP